MATIACEFVIFFWFLEVKTLLDDVFVLLVGPPESSSLPWSWFLWLFSHEVVVRFHVHGCVHHTEINWAARFHL